MFLILMVRQEPIMVAPLISALHKLRAVGS
jgi:hypothetical protein